MGIIFCLSYDRGSSYAVRQGSLWSLMPGASSLILCLSGWCRSGGKKTGCPRAYSELVEVSRFWDLGFELEARTSRKPPLRFPAPDPSAWAGRCSRVPGRSEEHTSELQSLRH